MKTILFTALLLVSLFSGSCTTERSFDARLKSIVRPHLFSIALWETKTLTEGIRGGVSSPEETVDDEIALVIEYFSTTKRINDLESEIEEAGSNGSAPVLQVKLDRLEERKTAMASTAERIIERQVREALNEQGIDNPFTRPEFGFPPVNFKLERLPYLLVVSPRERIESIREITLEAGLTPEKIEDIEAGVDELNVSSLVVELGGLGATYPTLVSNQAGLKSTINTAIEEWLHQYLVFKPLGFRYLLDVTGLSRDYEIVTINETLVGMVSQEIGSQLYEKYYSGHENGTTENQTPASGLDFNREMRAIRETVDIYLARGEVSKAEEFMGEKRQYLASMGYHIRKLNQAYFAFHGAYANKPAFISPVGLELKELRSRSPSLKDFLNTVAVMKSRQDLKNCLIAAGATGGPR